MRQNPNEIINNIKTQRDEKNYINISRSEIKNRCRINGDSRLDTQSFSRRQLIILSPEEKLKRRKELYAICRKESVLKITKKFTLVKSKSIISRSISSKSLLSRIHK